MSSALAGLLSGFAPHLANLPQTWGAIKRLGWEEEDRAMALADKGLADLGKHVTYGDMGGEPEGRERYLDFAVRSHPDKVRNMFNLGKHRTPVGLEAVQRPLPEDVHGNPTGFETMYALKVHNSKTGTTGPQTRNGTNRGDDEVVYIDPDRFMLTARRWAGLDAEMAAAGRGGRGGGGKGGMPWDIKDGRLFNKSTGQTITLPPGGKWKLNKDGTQAIDENTGRTIDVDPAKADALQYQARMEMAQKLAASFRSQFGMDTDEANVMTANLVNVGNAFGQMGFDAMNAMTQAAAILHGDNEITEMFKDAETVEEQAKAFKALQERLLSAYRIMFPDRFKKKGKGKGKGLPEVPTGPTAEEKRKSEDARVKDFLGGGGRGKPLEVLITGGTRLPPGTRF